LDCSSDTATIYLRPRSPQIDVSERLFSCGQSLSQSLYGCHARLSVGLPIPRISELSYLRCETVRLASQVCRI
jgi:hypothetical protein